nr:glycosyltransferase family 1 protein [uncultured Anaerostipes sp.]
MRICIDLTSLADNFSGIERFALSITKELIRNKEHEWVLIFKNSIHKEFDSTEKNVKKIVVKGNNKLLFNQIILPIKMTKIQADKYFFPAFPAPLFLFKKDVYNAIHDLSCWDCPGSNKRYMIWYFKIMYWKASLSNKKVITVSEFSKDRIATILHVKPKNIAVIYNGISRQFNDEIIIESERERIRKKYLLPERYILCLSTLEPRKNLKLLLDTYADLNETGIIREIVLAGRKGWKMDDFLNGYKKSFLQHVHFTGFVEDKDLPAVYKMADIFVFPSLYEGFGIPPLEAMACGTAVLASDATSMPEVLGNGAFYFKSQDKEDLKQMILYVEKNISDYNVEKGKKQARKYNWRHEARRLISFLENGYDEIIQKEREKYDK